MSTSSDEDLQVDERPADTAIEPEAPEAPAEAPAAAAPAATGIGQRLWAFVAGVLCVAGAAFAAWVALGGTPTPGAGGVASGLPVDGTLPGFSGGWNEYFGRVLFGGGSALTAVLAFLAFRDAFRPFR